jgi:hypothetical protein
VAVAVGLWGYLAWWIGARRAVTLVGIYVALMMWARMYVGAHYPQDVIGGLVVGLGVLALFVWLEDGIPEIWANLPDRARVSIVVLTAIVGVTFLFDSPDGMAMAGVLVGVLAALMVDARWIGFSAAGARRQKVLRYAIGAALLVAVYVGLKLAVGVLAEDGTSAYALLRGVRYTLVALFGVAGWPYLAARYGLAPMSAAAPDAQVVNATG